MLRPSVAVSGDTVVVGAENKNNGQGAAYVFVRNGTVWNQQQKLTASDGAFTDFFGCSVAVDGDTALVGANDKKIGSQGAAYVFVRSGTTWSQQQELTASDGAAGDDLRLFRLGERGHGGGRGACTRRSVRIKPGRGVRVCAQRHLPGASSRS